MNERYTALPLIAIGLKACAYILLVMSVITWLWRLIVGVPIIPGFGHDHFLSACVSLFYVIISWLVLLGASEGIFVLLDIEENTRRVADAAGATPKASAGN